MYVNWKELLETGIGFANDTRGILGIDNDRIC